MVQSLASENALNCPVGTYPNADELIREAVRWHFSPDTGSTFWLDRLDRLGFDPVAEIQTYSDLSRFPDFVNELRDVRVEELIPRGIDRRDVYGVFESGGTTGAPKRLVSTHEWMDRYVEFCVQGFRAHGEEPGGNWLSVMPTGPHWIGYVLREQAHRGGGLLFTVDMDPRWVKKCVAEKDTAGANRYAEHLVDQVRLILESQDCAVLDVSPPILERMARNDRMVDLMNSKVRHIQWGGTHMDADTRHLLRTEIFPDVTIQGGYGSTMVLGGGIERPGLGPQDPCIFDSMDPFVSFSVVDPVDRRPVAYGERGQVVMNLVSKGMFLPNNLERDMATRLESLSGFPGDAVADVVPVAMFEDSDVIEGVY